MAEDYDFTEQVRAVTTPTLVVGADADLVPPSHFVEVYGLLGGGKQDAGWDGAKRPSGGHALAILPGFTHYNMFFHPLFAETALTFLSD